MNQLLSEEEDLHVYRIAVLGASGVGKTQIVNRFVNNDFYEDHEPTSEDIRPYKKLYNFGTQDKPEYYILSIEDIFPINHPEVLQESELADEDEDENEDEDKNQDENEQDYDDDRNIKQETLLKILDNRPVLLKNKQMHKIYMKKQIYAYVFVFDVTNIDTFYEVAGTIEYIESDKKYRNQFRTVKIIVGNKIDLDIDNNRDKIKANKQFEELRIKHGLIPIFCSAKDNIKIKEIFNTAIEKIIADPNITNTEQDWQGEANENENQDDKKKKKKKQNMNSDSEEEKEPEAVELPEVQNKKLYKYNKNNDDCSIF